MQPDTWLKTGTNELVVLGSPLIPAKKAGPRFDWLDSREAIGVRLWYVRIVPVTG